MDLIATFKRRPTERLEGDELTIMPLIFLKFYVFRESGWYQLGFFFVVRPLGGGLGLIVLGRDCRPLEM